MFSHRSPVRLLFTLLLAGCLLAIAGRAEATDLSGRWKGRWESCVSGHKGPLRATLTRCDDQYRADFRGRFLGIVPFKYTVYLNIVSEGDVVRLEGENYLGRRFGTFYYDATADACSFHADYSSCEDHGVFEMERR